MSVTNYVLDTIAQHPKLSHGVALTTTGVSGTVQYVERTAGITPDNLSCIGMGVGIVASIVVVFANLRRISHEAKQDKLDAAIKRLEIERLRICNKKLEEEQEKRRMEGKPMRRKTDA